MKVDIRKANFDDIDPVRFLFRDTVISINAQDYKPEEIKVWSECYRNIESWKKDIETQHFLLAIVNDQIVGFGSIADNGYLDFLYVHKDFQQQGIATKLLFEIEKHANKLQVKKIFSFVSKTARSFFEKNGYSKTGEQVNSLNQIEFVNSVMEKNVVAI